MGEQVASHEGAVCGNGRRHPFVIVISSSLNLRLDEWMGWKCPCDLTKVSAAMIFSNSKLSDLLVSKQLRCQIFNVGLQHMK